MTSPTKSSLNSGNAAKEASSDGNGCPVMHTSSSEGTSSTTSSWNPMRWMKSSPNQQQQLNSGDSGGGCPVKHDNTGSALPASLEEAARHAQTPLVDQKIPLSTQRVISTIPRADELRPADEKRENVKHAPHQPGEGHRWVYPSEQQFYNAMRRKGWEADETTIPAVVQIHNAVNERGWSEVVRWERDLHGNENPRLVKFLGRPNDTSPKAWINSNMLFYHPPFDRHDWYVDRGDGNEPQRYVIDFYGGQSDSTVETGFLPSLLNRFSSSPSDEDSGRHNTTSTPSADQAIPMRPPSMYLDVRPALDNPEAARDRVHMFFRDAFPGLFGAFDSMNRSPQSTESSDRPSSA